jgi:hypothetical protein
LIQYLFLQKKMVLRDLEDKEEVEVAIFTDITFVQEYAHRRRHSNISTLKDIFPGLIIVSQGESA